MGLSFVGKVSKMVSSIFSRSRCFFYCFLLVTAQNLSPQVRQGQPFQETQKCPSSFISDYTNTSYPNIMASTAIMLEALQKFSLQNTELFLSNKELKNILNTRFGAITCAWPHYFGEGPELTKSEIGVLEKIMEYYFGCRGLNFIRADGFYEGLLVPNSYIVLDITESEMIELAKSFVQYSLVLFDKGGAKLLYLRGEHKNHFYAAKSWSEKTHENYTAVQTTDGVFKFSYDFDFDLLI